MLELEEETELLLALLSRSQGLTSKYSCADFISGFSSFTLGLKASLSTGLCFGGVGSLNRDATGVALPNLFEGFTCILS